MTTTPNDMRIVILGAGLAGASAAEELRKLGYTGLLTMVGSERHPPYERPPLSKSLLLGQTNPEAAYVHAPDWYAANHIDLVTATTGTGLDPAAQELEAGGRTIPYDRLLLTTGARPRRFPLADDSGAEVLYLRTLDDALALRDQLAKHLLIIGGGWIGLEVAAASRALGGTVTMVEGADLPLRAVLGPDLGVVFADLHREHGVDLRLGTTVTGINHADGATTVRLSDGTETVADLIVVGIGAVPNTDLATVAGLAVDNGILVDARLRTSASNVYAAGDAANQDHPLLGRIRVEHWDNAIEQGRHAARSMLGDATPYTRQPYFFSDQYDLGMEYVGYVGPLGYDEVRIQGDLQHRVFTAWWIRDHRVVAGMHAGDWDAIHQIRQFVGGPAQALPI